MGRVLFVLSVMVVFLAISKDLCEGSPLAAVYPKEEEYLCGRKCQSQCWSSLEECKLTEGCNEFCCMGVLLCSFV